MGFGSQELLIILAIVIILFGAKKIPDLAKGLGKGIKDFKKAVKEDDEEVSTNQEKIVEKESETQKESIDETKKA